MRRQPMPVAVKDSGPVAVIDVSQAATDFRIVSGVSPGMGPFLSLLPTEILFELMSYLPLSDVGSLALTSYELRNVVAQWIPSARCLAR